MKRRKILAASATALAVAAAFSTPSHVVAADALATDTTVQLYGHLDLSIDDATKGLSARASSPHPLTGKMGWQADISSNLSYFGLRGSHDIGGGNRMVFQIETQVDVAATPGLSPITNSTTDTKVPAALGSRNSFLGIAGGFGAVNLASRHPDLFGAAISLSGYFRAEGVAFGGSQSLMRANSPSSTVRETPAAQRVRFILVAGESDSQYLRSAEAFAAELDQLRVPHALFRLPGGHESWVWTNGLVLGLVELKAQLGEHGR